MPLVLIVDDYPDALDVWSLYLRSQGFQVKTASDGEDAIAIATAHLPDVVVLDLDLPGKSGIEVAAHLRADRATRHIPLIAATGHSHSAELDQARAAGFDAVIVKPCEPGHLVSELRHFIALAQQRTSDPTASVEPLT